MEILSITDAKYLEAYKIQLTFNNKKQKVVDFSTFFETNSHPQYNKYKMPDNFKKFTIENGNIVWGKDWDMIFPVYDLLKGKI